METCRYIVQQTDWEGWQSLRLAAKGEVGLVDEHRDEGGEEEADERGDQVGRVAVVGFAVGQPLLPSSLSWIGSFLNNSLVGPLTSPPRTWQPRWSSRESSRHRTPWPPSTWATASSSINWQQRHWEVKWIAQHQWKSNFVKTLLLLNEKKTRQQLLPFSHASVGSIRTCHFNDRNLVEQIKGWESLTWTCKFKGTRSNCYRPLRFWDWWPWGGWEGSCPSLNLLVKNLLRTLLQDD